MNILHITRLMLWSAGVRRSQRKDVRRFGEVQPRGAIGRFVVQILEELPGSYIEEEKKRTVEELIAWFDKRAASEQEKTIGIRKVCLLPVYLPVYGAS